MMISETQINAFCADKHRITKTRLITRFALLYRFQNACHNPKQQFKINNKKLPKVCGRGGVRTRIRNQHTVGTHFILLKRPACRRRRKLVCFSTQKTDFHTKSVQTCQVPHSPMPSRVLPLFCLFPHWFPSLAPTVLLNPR